MFSMIEINSEGIQVDLKGYRSVSWQIKKQDRKNAEKLGETSNAMTTNIDFGLKIEEIRALFGKSFTLLVVKSGKQS